jgi:hypothetical protein
VALDKDAEPSWWEGHEMLAIAVLGRSEPITEVDKRAVERAITPLFEIGAITTTRHASKHRRGVITVRYRLWLVQPAPDEKRREEHRTASVEKRRELRGSTRRKTSGAKGNTRRKVVSTPDEKRRTKEKEEDLKQEREHAYTALDLTDVEVAAGPPDQDHVSSVNGALHPEAGRGRQLEDLDAWIREHPEAAVVAP